VRVNGTLRTPLKSAFQNPNRVEGASRERPIFGEYFCVRAVYSSALDAYSKVLKRALKGFFDGIPSALDEAAMVDGCTRFGAFRRVTLPLILPGLTSVFVLTAILAWGEFVVPYVLISEPSRYPISIGILNFQGNYASNSTNILAAGGVLAMLPAIATFVILQRFIVRALTSGAIKG